MTLKPLQLIILGSPGIALLLGLGLLAVYAMNTRAVYLRLLSIAFVLFGLGVLVQVLWMPADLGINAMLSGALYVGSVLSLGEGVLQRIHRSLGVLFPASLAIAMLGGLYYFYYVDRDLVARILILNFGCAVVLGFVVLRARGLWKRTWLDRLLYLLLLGLVLSFFPRVFLTLDGVAEGISIHQFGQSIFWIVLQLTLILFGVSLAIVLMVVAVHDHIRVLDLERTQDPLTGLLNRRGLDEMLQRQSRHFEQNGMSILITDIDHFKSVNDTYGHESGDQVLNSVGKQLRQLLEPSALLARWGGEEFLICMVNADHDHACQVAHHLRSRIAQMIFDGLPVGFAVTASFGVTTANAGQPFSEVVRLADQRLYQAKASGRNRIVG